MSPFEGVLLGVVQGVTEFLPVSSSGHLVLFQSWFGIAQSGILFEVVLHVATLGAVIVFFFPALRKLSLAKMSFLALGTLPAAVIGVLFKSQIETLFDSILLVAIALLVTAALNLGIAYYLRREQDLAVTWKRSLAIGVAQAFAIVPGISRSGSTIFAGLQTGLSRKTAFEFSFLLSIPAIGGALLLQVLEVLQRPSYIPLITPMILGFIAAFVTGLFSLVLLKKILVTNKFSLFSWYTATVAVVVLLFELLGA